MESNFSPQAPVQGMRGVALDGLKQQLRMRILNLMSALLDTQEYQ